MPHKPRFNFVGVPQHVIQRGNNREPCFYSESDYHRYLSDLKESAIRHECRIHAYVLMTNHVHLLVTPMVEYGISKMMQALGRRYVCYVNKTYQRTGTLWEGRYKSSLIDSDHYLLTCMRYIELNPVRANMVAHPGDYAWSSYKVNAQGKHDGIIDSHPLYRLLGKDKEARLTTYRDLFEYHIDKETLHDIRHAANHELVVGRSYFKVKIEAMTKRQTRIGVPGRPKVEDETEMYLVGY